MIGITLAILCAVATTAVAASTQEAEAPKKAAKAADPNKRMCRAVETVNSAFASQECHTRAEWHAIDAAQEANAGSGTDARRARGQR